MKYGEVTTVKKTISFSLTTTTMTTLSSSLSAERVKGDYSTPSSLTTVNEPTVVTVVTL